MSNFVGPVFPPLLTGHTILPPNEPYIIIKNAIKTGQLEPGYAFWQQSEEQIKLAIYLEPEVSFTKAAQVLPVAMVAFSESMGAIAPPEFAIHFGWPNLIYANKAEVGHVQLFSPEITALSDIPDWLILNIEVAVQNSKENSEPGNTPDITTLSEEGCGHLSSVEITESLSRHFLTWLHIWEEEGFQPVHRAWLFRAFNLKQNIKFSYDKNVSKGKFIGLDEDGGQLIQMDQQTICIPLHTALKEIE